MALQTIHGLPAVTTPSLAHEFPASQGAGLPDLKYTGEQLNTIFGASLGPPLFKLQHALTKLNAGTKDVYINCMGDSLTVGYLAGNSPSGYIGAKINSYPRVLAASLRTLGYTVNDDAIIGDSNLFLNGVTDYGTYDPRVTQGTGWNLSSSANTGVGGNAFQNTTTDFSLTYTPTYEFDSLDIIYNTTPGAQSATIHVDAIQVGTINCNASNGIGKLTITGLTRKLQTIAITPLVAGGTYIAGIVPKDSTIKQIYLHTIAGAGAMASSWTSPTYGLVPFLPIAGYQYDLSIIGFGTNEAVTGVPVANFLTFMSTRKTLMQNHGDGDLVFQTGPPIDKVAQSAAAARQNGLTHPIYHNSAAYQFPVVDMLAMAGSYTDAVSANLMINTDAYHWVKLGYSKLAERTLYRILQGINLASKILTN